MAGAITIRGLPQLRKKAERYFKGKNKELIDLRGRILSDLMDALLENIPVWSGKTVRSLFVTSGPKGRREPHPDRGNYRQNGKWDAHPEWGDTKSMPLGGEPMRASSEAIARGRVKAAKVSSKNVLGIRSSSYMWDIIDRGTYRGPFSRNTPIVSQIAAQQIKSKYSKVVK